MKTGVVNQESRVGVYVDGFNLYFGLREEGWARYYWLDIQRLATRLADGSQVVSCKYFTSRVTAPQDKQKRQLRYLEALATLPGLQIVYGKYQSSQKNCHGCGRTIYQSQEKMTDVNIATAMLVEAFLNRVDVAILVSGDSDLVAPVKEIATTKTVIVAFPPKRVSQELRRVASSHFVIGRSTLAACQMPNPVITSAGVRIERPAQWA